MARQLYLFNNISPNIDKGLFYCFDTPQEYLEYLIEFRQPIIIDLNNYRINTNIVKVAPIDNIDFSKITYIIDADLTATNQYFRCYFVNSFDFVSDYYTFNCSVDLWGTYIYDARLNNAIITKCNRNIGKGIYDNIIATDERINVENAWTDPTIEAGLNEGISDKNVSIVFLLQYNVAQAVFGNDKITKTELFSISLNELKSKAVDIDANFDNFSSVEIAVDIIGGIFGVTTTGQGENDAQVIKAWLIGDGMIDTGEYEIMYGVTIKTKSMFTKGTTLTLNVSHVKPSIQYRRIVLRNYDINKIYYAGVFNNGLKLQRFTTKDLEYFTYFIVGDDDIKVIVSQGENQKDISSAFEVLLTTNSATETGIRRIARAINNTSKMFSSMQKAESKSGVVSAGITGLAGMVDMSADFEGAIGGGDGCNTFYRSQYDAANKTTLETPYKLTLFNSIENENENVRRYGANFKETIYSDKSIGQIADYVYTFEWLGNDATIDFNKVFIQLQCSVEEIPTEAANYIKQVLASGIYIFR